jgi:hypothetical protein
MVYIVAYRPVAKQWLCKQRPLLGNARNMHVTIEERVYAPVSKQRIDNHVLLETVFSILSVRSGYKEVVGWEGFSWKQIYGRAT